MSELMMADLLDAIAQPVYVKRSDHTWIYVNEAAAVLIGLAPEAIVGRCEADFLPQQVAGTSLTRHHCLSMRK